MFRIVQLGLWGTQAHGNRGIAMRFAILFLSLVVATTAQDKRNSGQTRAVDAGGQTAIASLPSGRPSAWTAIRGSSVSQISALPGTSRLFPNGTPVAGSVQCTYGTTDYTALTAAAPSQEVVIQTGVSGSVRWEQVTLSETTQFAGATGLRVSMGRPGSNHSEMTGTQFPLTVSSGDANFWTTRPIPPQLTSTYSIVLNFAVTSGNVNKVTAGVLTWELCGYAAR